jgi:hypothetical protein
MSVRIKFHVENMSPFLRRFSGSLYVEEVDLKRTSSPPIELFRCKFYKEQHSIGYSSFNNDPIAIPSKLFECMKPLLDEKIRSYYQGMVLDTQDFAWIMMEGDDSWNKLFHLNQEVINHIQNNNKDEMKAPKILNHETTNPS